MITTSLPIFKTSLVFESVYVIVRLLLSRIPLAGIAIDLMDTLTVDKSRLAIVALSVSSVAIVE